MQAAKTAHARAGPAWAQLTPPRPARRKTGENMMEEIEEGERVEEGLTVEKVIENLSKWADTGIVSHSKEIPVNKLNFLWKCQEELDHIKIFVLWLAGNNQADLARRLESSVKDACESLERFDRTCFDPPGDYNDHECHRQDAQCSVLAIAELLNDITTILGLNAEGQLSASA